MSCFCLSVGLCRDIEMMIRKFWCGQRGDWRKIHWRNWETLCKPKVDGGMGFKDLCKFNEAMLAKQVWRLVHDKTSLFYKVFKAKYFPNCSFFEAKAKSGSFTWRSILYARKVILMGAKWRVGDGTQIKIYGANWLPGETQGCVVPPPVLALSSAIVSALIDPLTYGWNSHTIASTFLPFEAKQIKSIPLGIIKQPDLLYWPWGRDGSCSVSTRYQRLCAEEQKDSASPSNLDKTHEFWKKLWKAGVPGKLKHFLWKACSKALPTKVSLLRRKIIAESSCPHCTNYAETVLHALWECDSVR